MSVKLAEALLQQFKKPVIPLEDISMEYLGIEDLKTLQRKANAGDFSALKIFKLRNSTKAPWLVDVNDLAAYIEHRKRQS